MRSAEESKLRWNVGWFRAENYNDLLFVASQQTGFGYFTNFGRTRRQGAEVTPQRQVQHFTLGGNYTFLERDLSKSASLWRRQQQQQRRTAT